MSDPVQESRKYMERAIEHLRSEFSKMRVGRASTAMIEGVRVAAYGSEVSIKEVAALSIPDARTIAIQPWDRTVIGDIERAILGANLGLTPINDGKLIRISLPALTEERRKEHVKHLKKLGEDAKVGIRNVRRDSNDALKRSKDEGDLTEDDVRRVQDSVQKVTDQFIAEVDKLVESKSKEVMTL